MAWREIIVGRTRWSVSPVAEKTNRSGSWRLVLAFRPNPPQRPSVLAPTGLKADSRNDLFVQADRLSDDKLSQALTEKLG